MFNSLLNSNLAAIISQFQSIFRSSTLQHDTVDIFPVRFLCASSCHFWWGGGTPQMIHIIRSQMKTLVPAPVWQVCPLTGKPSRIWAIFAKAYWGTQNCLFFFALCAKGGRFCWLFAVWIKTFTLFPQITFSSMPLCCRRLQLWMYDKI